MGVRVGAYLIDEFIVRVAFALPVQLLLGRAIASDWLHQIVPLVLFPVYFFLLEGLTGRSWGKWLVGLRVCRQGTTQPPGLRRAAIRTLVFYLLVTVTVTHAWLVVARLRDGPPGPEILLNLVPFVVGLLILVVPMRRSNDFRGLHETLSGTCVLRLPQVPRPLKLVGRHGDRLLAVPPRPAEFPETVGPFSVARAVAVGDQWVAVGDDAVLGRRVLMRLYPDRGGPPVRSAGGQPGRLWPLGRGTANVGGAPHRWEAFVAPTGAPIADVVDARHRVRWPEARPVLEQIAVELAAAEKDGSLPGQLSLDQVWVQPDGRPQLLDFPIAPTGGLTSAVGVLHQAAVNLLEGGPRSPIHAGPIRAPLPGHASRLLSRLAGGPDPITRPADFADELAATRDRPARVTRAARALQLAIQAGTVGIGLVVMFAISGLYSVFLALDSPDHLARLRRARAAERLVALAESTEGRAALSAEGPAFVDRLPAKVAAERAALNSALPNTNRAERYVLNRLTRPERATPVGQLLSTARDLDVETEPVPPLPRVWWKAWVAILFWPMVWAASAFVFRGGLSYLLTGIRIVRATGGPATRRQCALRSLVVWGPIALLLCGAVLTRAQFPEHEVVYRTAWWAALLELPLYVLAALLVPERGSQDRLLNTWLVPR
jgi:hypothetical protein